MLRLQKYNDYIRIYLTFFILYKCAFCRFILYFQFICFSEKWKRDYKI